MIFCNFVWEKGVREGGTVREMARTPIFIIYEYLFIRLAKYSIIITRYK